MSVSIATFAVDGTEYDARTFAGDELAQLFDSDSAREALKLPTIPVKTPADLSDLERSELEPGIPLRAARDIAKTLTWAASALLPQLVELPWAFPVVPGYPVPSAKDAPLVIASALDSMRANPALIHLVSASADQVALMVAAVFGNRELERMGAPPVGIPSDADTYATAEALHSIILELRARGWTRTSVLSNEGV